MPFYTLTSVCLFLVIIHTYTIILVTIILLIYIYTIESITILFVITIIFIIVIDEDMVSEDVIIGDLPSRHTDLHSLIPQPLLSILKLIKQHFIILFLLLSPSLIIINLQTFTITIEIDIGIQSRFYILHFLLQVLFYRDVHLVQSCSVFHIN